MPFLSKVLEKVVLYNYVFLKTNCVFDIFQSGFRSRHTNRSALLKVLLRADQNLFYVAPHQCWMLLWQTLALCCHLLASVCCCSQAGRGWTHLHTPAAHSIIISCLTCTAEKTSSLPHSSPVCFWPSSVTLWLLKAVFLEFCLLCLCELAASPSFPCSSSPLPPTLPNLVARALQSRVSDLCCLQPCVPPPYLPTLLQCSTSSKTCTKFCCFLFNKQLLLF